jgi:surfactin synthase thioesterase subunit
LNLLAPRISARGTLADLAHQIDDHLRRWPAAAPPVIVGECQAAPLACETAAAIADRVGDAPVLILLDPWLPRSMEVEIGRSAVAHPRAIARYFKLLRLHEPRPYPGQVHVVCASATGRLTTCLTWWRARLGPHCVGHQVPGTHDTYIRDHRRDLGETIATILSTTTLA